MESILEQKLLTSYKEEMIAFLNAHPEYFDEAIKLAVGNEDKLCWRAAFLLWGSMEENDPRIKKHINKIIKVIPEKKDGHQRELIKILSKMKLNEDQEGKVFNICVDLWEQLDKVPSIRHTAFKVIMATARKYPELSEEISVITQNHYLETLSPGVRHSILRMISELVDEN